MINEMNAMYNAFADENMLVYHVYPKDHRVQTLHEFEFERFSTNHHPIRESSDGPGVIIMSAIGCCSKD